MNSCFRIYKLTHKFYLARTTYSKNVLSPSCFNTFSFSRAMSGGVLKPGEDAKQLSKDEWKQRLKPMEYCVCRESDTEKPFSGVYENHFEPGTYTCVCCGTELFDSKTKYKTSCGWPSFYAPINQDLVTRKVDTSFGRIRTETVCSKCNAHLGHVFDDGPKPTGERFCINSVALNFKPKDSSNKDD